MRGSVRCWPRPRAAGNNARTSAGTASEKTGTVALSPAVRTAAVTLAHPAG